MHCATCTNLSIQVSSVWAGTWDCTKMEALEGSMPQATYSAALLWVDCSSALGSCGSVMACRSTTQKKVSAGQECSKSGKGEGVAGFGGGSSGPPAAAGVCPHLHAIPRCRSKSPVKRLTILFLQLHPVADGPQVISQVQAAGGLHSRQHALPPRRSCLARLVCRGAAACLGGHWWGG